MLASYQVGDGPHGVVLLHGYLGSGRNLRSLANAWVARDASLRCFVPDLTGHGESPPLPPDATLASIAADVHDAALAAGLTGPLRWVGHSFGGRVALAAARRFAHAMTGIDLVDITPGPIDASASDSGKVVAILAAAPDRAPDRAAMRGWLADRLPAALADWLAMNVVPASGGGFTWRVDRAALQRAHRRVLGEDLWDVVQSGAVRIRCARGARSSYVPDADVDRLIAAGCPVITLESGHFVHVDALDALVDWLLRDS